MEFFNSLEKKDLVTLIGITLTFIVGFLTLTQSLQKIKLDNLTQHRVEWINTLRKYVADFLSEIDMYKVQVSVKENTQLMMYRERMTYKASLIILHLNFKGSIDKKILKNLNEITNTLFLTLYINNLKRYLSLNKNPSLNTLIFKNFVDNNPDKIFINFLKEYASKNNIHSKLNSLNIDENSNEYLKAVINDYTSVVNTKSYINEFQTKLNSILNELFSQITNNRNNLTKLVQIYLKAEWTRAKKEIRFISYYNEEKTLRKLEKEWYKSNSSNS